MRFPMTFGAMCLALGAAAPVLAGPTMPMPEVSLGSAPFRSFSGVLLETPTDLLTVPAGQEFIVTMVVSSAYAYCSRWGDWENGTMLMRDTEIALAGNTIGNNSTIPVAHGEGRLPVLAGSTLSIKAVISSTSDRHYYVQGYFIQEGSPYRSFFDSTAHGRVVLTVEEGKQFLVRTIALSSRSGPSHCHVYVDGTRMLHGSTYVVVDRGTYDGGQPGGFAKGHGTLLLTEGMTLEVGPEDPSTETQCDYYIAGEYLLQ